MYDEADYVADDFPPRCKCELDRERCWDCEYQRMRDEDR